MIKKGDKVVVRGLEMAFIVLHDPEDGVVTLVIEGDDSGRTARAKCDVVLPNNTATMDAENWLNI